MNTKNKTKYLVEKQRDLNFSGAYYAKHGKEVLTGAQGYANHTDQVRNKMQTRFSIASGSKIFTALAICMLIDEGKLSIHSKLDECLDIDFPHFNQEITIHQLLIHISGMPDYFDEDLMDDFEDLWKYRPMYHMRSLTDFLPLFQFEEIDDNARGIFQYNNAGYILLGLIVEAVSQRPFTDFVAQRIFKRAGMLNSGYFEMDRLPKDTATGYIDVSETEWRSNIYSLPVKGGADGGAFVTVQDRYIFWHQLIYSNLLSDEMLQLFLKPRVVVDKNQHIFYSYSGYMELDEEGEVIKYIQMGYDPGVNFREVYYPETNSIISVCSNEEDNAFEMLKAIEAIIFTH